MLTFSSYKEVCAENQTHNLPGDRETERKRDIERGRERDRDRERERGERENKR